jgi:hypothetical protein
MSERPTLVSALSAVLSGEVVLAGVLEQLSPGGAAALARVPGTKLLVSSHLLTSARRSGNHAR